MPVTLELTEVWRQADPTFISLLQAVRLGRWVWKRGRGVRMQGWVHIYLGWQVSRRLGWSRSCCQAKDDLELLILLPPPPQS